MPPIKEEKIVNSDASTGAVNTPVDRNSAYAEANGKADPVKNKAAFEEFRNEFSSKCYGRMYSNYIRAATPDGRSWRDVVKPESVSAIEEKFKALEAKAKELGYIGQDETLDDKKRDELINILLGASKGGELDETRSSQYKEFSKLLGDIADAIDANKNESFISPSPRPNSYEPMSFSPISVDSNLRKKLGDEFINAVDAMAARLGTKSEWILGVMSYETGGTFSPSARNKKSGATGLIQFMPKTAAGLGTSTGALADMSALEQLVYVEKYFESKKGRLNSFNDVCMAVFFPAAIGKGEDHVLFRAGTKAYTQNPLDKNQDGAVDSGEYISQAEKHLARVQTSTNQDA